jgi:hypothetical protein
MEAISTSEMLVNYYETTANTPQAQVKFYLDASQTRVYVVTNI